MFFGSISASPDCCRCYQQAGNLHPQALKKEAGNQKAFQEVTEVQRAAQAIAMVEQQQQIEHSHLAIRGLNLHVAQVGTGSAPSLPPSTTPAAGRPM